MSVTPVNPDFYDSVVVTSARTHVDTDEVIHAATRVHHVARLVESIYNAVLFVDLRLTTLSFPYAYLAGSGTAIEEAIVALRELLHQLTSLSHRLTAAAMRYVSAEGDVLKFLNARNLLVSDRVAWMPLSPLTPAHMVISLPLTQAGVGMTAWQTWTYADEFMGRRAGDATLGYRVEFDVATMGTTVNSWSTYRSRYGYQPDPNVQAWWGATRTEGVDAARVASQLFFTVGQRKTGPVAGLQITTSQIVDAGGSGRPVSAPLSRIIDPTVPQAALEALYAFPTWRHASKNAVNAALRARPGPASTHFSPTPRAVRVVPTPRSGSELLSRISQLESGNERFGQLEILKHETPRADGSVQRSWTVVVRGTQMWEPGQANPQDMQTNLQAVGHEDNDLSAATLEAMKMAGIAPDEPVEFVGHSQSGITNTQLIADTERSGGYTIVSSLTAGSPTGNYVMPQGVHTLFMENTRDIVPPLDGAPNMDVNDAVTVSFDGHLLGQLDGDGLDVSPHGLEPYKKAFDALNDPAASNAPPEIRQWSKHRTESLGLTDRTVTTSQLFNTQRLFDEGH